MWLRQSNGNGNGLLPGRWTAALRGKEPCGWLSCCSSDMAISSSRIAANGRGLLAFHHGRQPDFLPVSK